MAAQVIASDSIKSCYCAYCGKRANPETDTIKESRAYGSLFQVLYCDEVCVSMARMDAERADYHAELDDDISYRHWSV